MSVVIRWLRTYWFPVFLAVATFVACLFSVLEKPAAPEVVVAETTYRDGDLWQAPSENEIPFDDEGEAIRFGKELIVHTAKYLGPHGTLKKMSNGMNCQNCHTYAGTQNFGNPFSAVASTYPKYRDRSGRVESIEFRVNDCFLRSMNGSSTLDSQSREMQAIVAYIKWVGKGVPKAVKPKGAGVKELTYLNRPADPQKGRAVYSAHCQRCHGENGAGVLQPDASEYVYPPLWGEHSFNVGAGLYRLSSFAGFVKNNMPFGTNWNNPELTDEQAWDVAAYVVSQPRPEKAFPNDWKNVAKKPVDYPFGPYADSFSEARHKYGPFADLKKK